MSTRLFPKNRGADRYTLSGIAARCDWVLLSDNKAPHTHLQRNVETECPRHIFVSLRAPFYALRAFVNEILPSLEFDFVLITGSEDITLPMQVDFRWRRLDSEEQVFLRQIADHVHLRHWYCENLDRNDHAKRSPLPLGLVFPDGNPEEVKIRTPQPLDGRALRVFCAHRHREGPQWELRRRVSSLAGGHWRHFCTVPDTELPEPEFMREVERHAFVVCAEGGGLDPAPKAWSALLHGAIPIIRATALAPAYAHLPVVMLNDWCEDAITPEKLAGWRAQLLQWFDIPQKRQEVLHRLSIDYWWEMIAAGNSLEASPSLAVV